MSQYIQLLGTDTPNGFGGCCYYGPLDHPGLQASPSSDCPPSHSFPAPATCQNLLRLPLEAAIVRLGGSAEPSSKGQNSLTDEKMNFTNHNDLNKKSKMSITGTEGYLFFNCPEGTQRFSSEANIKLNKIKGFFFTRWGGRRQTPATTAPTLFHRSRDNKDAEVDVSQCGHKGSEKAANTNCEPHHSAWDSLTTAAASAGTAVMGLPGLLFTINDSGVQHVNVFGPSSVQLALQAWLAKLGDDQASGARGKATLMPHMAGLEKFLVALRVSYFSYRPMVFRLLTPTFLPPLSTLNKVIQLISCGSEKDNLIKPLAECFSSSTPIQKEVKTTAVARDEIFLLPPFSSALIPSPVHMELGRKEVGFNAEVPFIVAVLPLSSQSVLIAFRVSGGIARNHTSDAYAHKNSEACREGTSAVDIGDDENAFSEFLPDLSELVLGYAIVNAPQPAFDAGQALALGVRPGPKYAQLKQGIAVYADISVGVESGKTSRRARRDRNGTASPEGVPMGKNNRRVHTACSSDDINENTIGPNVETVSAPPTQGKNTEPEFPRQHQPRLVEPHEVTFPTFASQHLYVSLVLDGNSAADVRTALEKLLGTCDWEKKQELENWRGAYNQTKDLSSYDNTKEREVGGGGCSELIRILRESFPCMAYTSSPSNPDTCDEQKRKLRTVVIRHVVHTQPLSYFIVFNAQRDNSRIHKGSPTISLESNSNSSLLHESVYRKYLSTIFATVHQSVQHSSFPMMSFTMADLVEEDISATIDPNVGVLRQELQSTKALMPNEAPEDNAGRPSRPDLFTKHLFTAFIQTHFTAFPTALVHQYHLHAIAPGSFPVPPFSLPSRAEAAEPPPGLPRTSEGALQPIKARPPSAARSFWPYSFKFCSVPPPQARPAPRPGQFPDATRPTAGRGPRKTTRGVSPDQAIPARSSSLAIYPDGGGGTQCIRYPDARSAEGLLSAEFQAILREQRAPREGTPVEAALSIPHEAHGGGGHWAFSVRAPLCPASTATSVGRTWSWTSQRIVLALIGLWQQTLLSNLAS
ncbi:unnamed protein product [Phytomonas sp. Hart1]|nr:unnamed protein product [Phytomonas sp. Hart1]|eukprot:CCW68491.1 unnamed protein product [Phytomonas sp. isolate Hart1]